VARELVAAGLEVEDLFLGLVADPVVSIGEHTFDTTPGVRQLFRPEARIPRIELDPE
jgi:hypothetical protein